MENKPIISESGNSAAAFKNSLKFSVIILIVGILGVVVGRTYLDSLSYFSKDIEWLLGYVIFGLGLMGIGLATALPLCAKYMAGKCHIAVYADHIEGMGYNIINNMQTFIQFHEVYDHIQSVSIDKQAITINLSSGHQLRCIIEHAEKVAETIRSLL